MQLPDLEVCAVGRAEAGARIYTRRWRLLNHDEAGLICRRTKTGGVAPVMRHAGAKSYAAERWPTTPLTSNWPTNLCSLLALRRTVSALLCRIAAVSRMSLED